MIEFQECNECRKRQGTPVLCPQCLMLRQLVSEHNDFHQSLKKVGEYSSAAMLMAMPQEWEVPQMKTGFIRAGSFIFAVEQIAWVSRAVEEATVGLLVVMKNDDEPHFISDPDGSVFERVQKALCHD